MQANNIDYCCKFLTPSISSIEKGVEAIETILAKRVLCRHDVKKINKIYRRIEHFERLGQLSKLSSNSILEKVVEKIAEIVAEKNHFGLVSLYHLQGFLDEGLNLEKHFSQMWSQVEKNPEIVKEMATYLSCCHSGQKRGKPQDYPPYFQEILEKGYIHLYDHLIHMRTYGNRTQRLDKIKKISFSLLSHIILETRSAILQKVKNAISDRSSNILFLIGGTGAGKSTTLCFLRGDEMVQENFCYQSKRDRSGLIGDDIATSCTFLPTIEKINDWMIVDFPGFEDTNGPLISLGIEFALKALIKEYRPRILVLQSITNTQAAKEQGECLKRLFRNTENCMLGITKYSKDPDFIEIKNLEVLQRKEQSKPSPNTIELQQALQKVINEELELVGALEYAIEDGYTEDSIKEMEIELAEWRQKKEKIELELVSLQKDASPDTEPLADTLEKTERKKKIEEKENVLTDQIGIKNIFRFDNLDDHQLVFSCFESLSKINPIHPSIENQLGSVNERIINECFEKDLKNQMQKKFDFQLDFENFDPFKASVLETSFISTIYSQSHPEIGSLFHLTEMDPNIVHKYDKVIIGDSIKNIIEMIICTLDFNLIHKIMGEIKDQISQINLEKFREKMIRLQNYILVLTKEEHPVSQVDTEEKWAILRQRYKEAIKRLEKIELLEEVNARLSRWIVSCKSISWNISSLRKATFNIWFLSTKEEFILKMMDPYSRCLDQMYDFILKLKELETIIMKYEHINSAFRSARIATDSIEELHGSIKNRINKVREIYGKNDWDRRVGFLKDNFKTIIPKKLFPWFFSMCAYLFIEPNVSYDIRKENREFTSRIKFIVDKKSFFPDVFLIDCNNLFSFSENLYITYKETCITVKDSRFTIWAYWDRIYDDLEFPEQWINYFNEPLLINRVLNAAAFLQANERL